MGSFIEINDTLQLTKKQGFPVELKLEKHLKTPYSANDFTGKIFVFKDKPDVRIFKAPPVRNFLVENRNGKWVYWGLVHILEVSHDYLKRTTSGTFTIIYIYPPEDMKKAHELMDRRKEKQFFTK